MRIDDKVAAIAISIFTGSMASAVIISLFSFNFGAVLIVCMFCFVMTTVVGVPLSLLIHGIIRKSDSLTAFYRIVVHMVAGYGAIVMLELLMGVSFKASLSLDEAIFAFSGAINGLVYGSIYELFRQKWGRVV
ncbi:hypothetical protein [Paenibacillus radicis (ex Gao et al. 2016)]|uniref:Uncharacterized protein n=1 Tax=Paenibacillus radicis (ex Gao et al. 2016) TaxID=1737354 RepID=A0A917H8Q2_9BACL|nr:hypothetical protein [Paenibacillus radicis (ex Gao et al. 2016)]GGG70876.1 hypothetical protein GCM10010918_27920 [Paenibacillus radicis (ex Gao et al. 2016)]